MKLAVVLCSLMLIMSGCGSGNRELERGMALRSEILKSEVITFSADISADYGDSLQLFSVDCVADGEGSVSFTVTAPETVAGITGMLSGGTGKLTFDGAALQFSLLTDEQLNPAGAPWIFMKTLRSGCLTAAGMDGELLRLTVDDSYENDALKLDIWLDEGDVPVRSEIVWDGRRILTLSVRQFRML